MRQIKKAIMKRALKEFYALNELEGEAYARELAKFSKKVRKDSAPQKRVLSSLKVTKHACEGGAFYRAVPRTYRSNKVVFYIHGGGFFLEAFDAHWSFCARLAKRTGCEIIFPEYPLVPEHNCVDTLAMLMDLYRKVLQKHSPKDVTIMGDSAGGTLALSVSLLARDRGLPPAHEIVLISPGFVVECENEKEKRRLEEIKKHDFMLGDFPIDKIQKLWIPKEDLDGPKSDVTKRDPTGLPRITMFSGTYDILNVPARKYYKKLKALRQSVHYVERKHGIHVYALFPSAKPEFDLIVSRVLG